jgi:hypothetical protein
MYVQERLQPTQGEAPMDSRIGQRLPKMTYDGVLLRVGSWPY